MIKMGVIGLGRAGKEIAKMILDQDDMKLVLAICASDSEFVGKDLGKVLETRDTGIIIAGSHHLEKSLHKNKPDVVIDFTVPEATLHHIRVCGKANVNMVIGTTGFTEIQEKNIAAVQKKDPIGIVIASNITLGVNLMMLLSRLTASILNNYDFEIVETHHRHKVDAPSGTAKKIAYEIEKGLNVYELSSVRKKKEHNDIQIHALRAGGVIGRHRVLAVGENDKIEIIHESFSRKVFAEGALKAARFVNKKAGLFEMKDVIDLRNVLLHYLETEGLEDLNINTNCK